MTKFDAAINEKREKPVYNHDTFLAEQKVAREKREKRLNKNETLHITVEVRGCEDCRHTDHSGSFTHGGAREICGHSDACDEVRKTKEEFLKEYPMYAEREYDGKFRYHWYNRIVDTYMDKGTIPEWCPLKNGSGY